MSDDRVIRLPVQPRLVNVGMLSEDEKRQWALDRLRDAVRVYRTVCGSRQCLHELIVMGIEECELLERWGGGQ